MHTAIREPGKVKAIAALFVAAFVLAMSVLYATRSIAQSSGSATPSSGSCALLMTLPVPYGFEVTGNTSASGVRGTFQTGYNLIGQIVFNSASSGTFSGRIINPTFNYADSPFIDANGGAMDINGLQVQITPMSSSTGFTGGHTFTFSGTYQGRAISFSLAGVPANNGKTILMASTSTGTLTNPGIGPGSGICQV